MNTETFKSEILPIKDKLYRLALRMLVNPAEAQDAVQEVFLKLWDQRHKLKEVQNLEAWSVRITKNLCLDKLRSKHRKTENLERVPEKVDAQSTADRQIEQSEMMIKIKGLMNRLPEKQKLVMHLRDIEELSYREIGEALDMPEQHVKTNLFRARKKMRAYLQKTVNYG